MILNSEKLAVYSALADDMDAGLDRLDEVAADMIREIMPEWHEAVEVLNTALVEIDRLLFDGLRDEALGMHASALFDVAWRFSLKQKPNWDEIRDWFVFNELGDPPDVDVDSLENIQAAQSELEKLDKALSRLRRYALVKESIPKKLQVLRQIRKHDPTKIVWANQIALYEDALQRGVRESVKRALHAGDFSTIAECHVALVDPEWSGEVAKDLVKMTQGAELALQIQEDASALSAAYDGLVDLHSSNPLPTPDMGQKVAAMLAAIAEHKDRIADGAAVLRAFSDVYESVKKQGLLDPLEENADRVVSALEWGSQCESLSQTTLLFQQECMRIERLCEHLPGKKEESAWMADVERCDGEIKRCCQVIPALVYPDFLRSQLLSAKTSVRRRGEKRKTVALVLSGFAALLVCALTGGVGYYFWSQYQWDASVATLEKTVEEARFGMHDKRPESLERVVEGAADDATVVALVEEFDGHVAVELERRTKFESLVASVREYGITAAADVDSVEQLEDPNTKLEAWPKAVADMAGTLVKARAVGGYPKNRPGYDAAEGDMVVAVKGPHFEEEEEALAELLKEYRSLDQRLEKAAAAAFSELRAAIQARVDALSEDTIPGDRRDLLGDIAALKQKASSPKYSGEKPEDTGEVRVTDDLVNALDVLAAKVRQGQDG